MSRQLASKFQHRYLPPESVHKLRCEYCVHFFENENRCGLIAADQNEVKPEGCCRFWYNADVLAEAYPGSAQENPRSTQRRPTMRPPDLGRLLTKAEASFVEDADKIQGCGDCQFFLRGGSCTLIGENTVDADGGCSAFWRNVRQESARDDLHAEFKEPPPEVKESGFLRRILNSLRGD